MNKNALLVMAIIGGITMTLKKDEWRMPNRGLIYKHAINEAEKANGLPNNLLGRVAYQESRFRQDIISGETVSSAGAQGLMQIVPRWHPNVDPLDPFDSIKYSAKYLKKLHSMFGSWDKALAAYNWGMGNLRKAIAQYGDGWINYAPKETQNYVKEITADIPV